MTSRRLGEDMRRRQQRGDRGGFDLDYVSDRIFRTVRRPNPVGDQHILVRAWRQERRTAFESVTASLEDIDNVDFDGGVTP